MEEGRKRVYNSRTGVTRVVPRLVSRKNCDFTRAIFPWLEFRNLRRAIDGAPTKSNGCSVRERELQRERETQKERERERENGRARDATSERKRRSP